MDTSISETSAVNSSRVRKSGDLSYKFQRLRERLRQAVTTGELTGKLPGERVLAKRYNCNAKTLSKALTDLAAEGLLDRSIGRGTYVRGSAPADEGQGPWLVLGEGHDLESQYLRQFVQHNPRCQLVVGEPQQRPSFVNQFAGVIDVASATPESFLRDLVVRGIPVVVIGREPRTYSLDCVLVDVSNGAARLAKELLQLGHRRFMAVEPMGQSSLTDSLKEAISRPGLGATVDSVSPNDVTAAVQSGVTALICDSEETAQSTMKRLADAGISVPEQVSVAAVGVTAGNNDRAVTGCYVPMIEVVENATRLLADTQPRRPATLWLAPLYVSRQTTAEAPTAYQQTTESLGTAINPN